MFGWFHPNGLGKFWKRLPDAKTAGAADLAPESRQTEIQSLADKCVVMFFFNIVYVSIQISRYLSIYKYIIYILVGCIPTLLKNMKVNEKDDIPYMKWKIKVMFQTTNQIYIYIYEWFLWVQPYLREMTVAVFLSLDGFNIKDLPVSIWIHLDLYVIYNIYNI